MQFPINLPAFQNVVFGQKATLAVPRYALSLNRIQLQLGGTLTIANITEISIKLGAREVTKLTGPRLLAINKYKGIYDAAGFLTIDFTERDADNVLEREIGGYDFTVIQDQMFIEVTNNMGAGSPTLVAKGMFGAPQGQAGVLVKKYLTLASPSLPATSGQPYNFGMDFKGARVQRIHLSYTGTDWSGVADGNLNRVELKADGTPKWDLTSLQANYLELEYRKVPQSKFYHLDFIHDNDVVNGALATAGIKSMELNCSLTAADSLTAIVEVLDLPGNL